MEQTLQLTAQRERKVVLILGEPGSGKSRAIQGLDPNSTFFFNVWGKPLPNGKAMKNYYPKRNYLDAFNFNMVINGLQELKKNKWCWKAPDNTMIPLKSIVIDDAQFLFGLEFVSRCKEQGYNKYNDIGASYINMVNLIMDFPGVSFITSHIEQGESVSGGKVTKAKTIGKMLDNMFTIDGLFTIVILAQTVPVIVPGEVAKHVFVLQNDGSNGVKTPEGMFMVETESNGVITESPMFEMENNLELVRQIVEKYYA